MLARAEAVAAATADRCGVLVVGGGITGAGAVLDAATRGYSVALVERADYAIGTSSRSSKLVHGGLRYLQNVGLGGDEVLRPRGARGAAGRGRAARAGGADPARHAGPARRDAGRIERETAAFETEAAAEGVVIH
jgi:glycine/D-amino acid oxidase-like deaminating enzyme